MRQLFLTLSFIASITIASAQQVDATLDKYVASQTPEKVHLHLDKSLYAPGDTAWFKGYVMEDIFPADKSKTLYVDWIAPDGKVLLHTTAPIVDGITNGQFAVPRDYSSDYIHVRAYTRWMLNSDTAFLYQKELRIISAKPAGAAPSVKAQLDFFPEGGDLVAGLNNRLAFKASDQWGRPAKIRGAIKTDKGRFIDSLRFFHAGMGSIYIIPEAGVNYQAVWKDEKGIERTTSLPAIKNSGVTLQVGLQGSRRTIRVETTKDLAGTTLHLLGTMNGRKAFQTTLSIAPSGEAQRVIPVETLPSGVLTFTLFDASWNAIAERVSFVNNHEYRFKPQFEVTHWGLGTRKRNEIEIRLPDSVQAASLSIAVTDVNIENDTSANIVSQLLLSSEIKGKVFNPAYYFATDDESRALQLDYVMITHGWRRFKWEEINKGILPKVTNPRDTSYLVFGGQLFGVAKSVLSGNESIAIMMKAKDSSSKMSILSVDKEGRFSDPSLILFDTIQVYYSLKSKLLGRAEARFMTERLPSFDYSAFSRGLGKTTVGDTAGTAYHLKLAMENARLEGLRRGKVLETVVVTAKQKSAVEKLEERYTSGLFKGGDGYQIDMMSNPNAGGYMDIFQYLQGRIAGLQVSGSGPNTVLTWRGGSPQVYLDEFLVDIDMASAISVGQIAYVKVFRPPFFGSAGGGAGGAIAIYTKKGEDLRTAPGGLLNNAVYGYTPIRQFFSPNYERMNISEPDLRTTLYWNPDIELNPGRRAIRLTFFNNDFAKSFRVVIEGMSREGLLTHMEEIME